MPPINERFPSLRENGPYKAVLTGADSNTLIVLVPRRV